MTESASLHAGLTAIVTVAATMAAVAVVEAVVPLHARGRWHRLHLGPTLAWPGLTFATNLLMHGALLSRIVALAAHGAGLLRWLAVPPVAAAIIGVLALDLAFYAAHVSWHAYPSLWRFHAVHHSDPAVDVTT